MRAQGPGGLVGNIPVSAYTFINGRCSGGEATVDTVVTLWGSGPLRAPDAGTHQIRVQGEVPLRFQTKGSLLWLRAYLYVRSR